jgi:hypothetical protein
MIDPSAPWSSALPDFLLARYDEAQRRAELAQQVIAGGWDCWEVVAQQLHACCDTVPMVGRVGQMLQLDADPARVLADLAAKRRRLERHRTYDFPPDADDGPGDYAWTPHCDACHEPWPCFDLRNDAAPYAACADYDEAWRIDE